MATTLVVLLSVCHAPSWAIAEVISGFSEDVLAISDNTSGTVGTELQNAIESFSPDNDEACLERLQLCVERHPELPPAQVMLATLHCRFNQPQRARNLLREIETQAADDPGYVLTLARVYLTESRNVEGMALIDRSILLANASNWSPDRQQRFVTQANLQKLQIFESQKKWTSAARLLSKSFQSSLNSIAQQNNALRIRYARALFFTGQVDVAKEQLNQSGIDDSRLALAQWHNEVGQYGEAELLLRDVVNSSNNPMLRIALANYLLDRNKVDHALDVISSFIDAAPTDATESGTKNPNQAILSRVGIEFEQQGVSQQDLASEKVQNEIAIVRGRIAMLRGNLIEAVTLLQRVYQSDGSRLYVANLFARALIACEDSRLRQQGIDIAFSKAVQHDSNIECAATLAWAQLHLNQVATSEAGLMNIASRHEISADVAYFASRALAANGKTNLAQSLVRRALDSAGPFDLRDHANKWASDLLPTQIHRQTEQVSSAADRISVARRTEESPTRVAESGQVSDDSVGELEEPDVPERRFVIDPDALFSGEASESK